MAAWTWLMMRAGGTQGPRQDTNYRIPPFWSPEHSQRYSFRQYSMDLMFWVLLTDLQPHQQIAAIILRLGGAAGELARSMTPQEMFQGGVVNGVQLDPVSYLLNGLQVRFAQLGE